MAQNPFEEFEDPREMNLRLPSGRVVRIPEKPSDDLIDVLSGVEDTDLRQHAGFMRLLRAKAQGAPRAVQVAAQTGAFGAGDPNAQVTPPNVIGAPRTEPLLPRRSVMDEALNPPPPPPHWADPSVPGWSVYDDQEAFESHAADVAAQREARAQATRTQRFLDQIAVAEGTDSDQALNAGFASVYDVPYGFEEYVTSPRPLTSMTLGEIDALQTQLKNDPRNFKLGTAAGKYQIVQRTLRDLRRQLGLGDDVVFDEALQERLARTLLERRGYSDYLSGRISASDFQDRLALEWDSLSSSTGASADKAMSADEVLNIILSLTPP